MHENLGRFYLTMEYRSSGAANRHRGPDPEDAKAFGPVMNARLGDAVNHLSLFLTLGYGRDVSARLVGDRFQLMTRQSAALLRMACADREQERRRVKQTETMTGQTLLVDAINVVRTVETALGGGVVLACRDGTYRDIASTSRTFRAVCETEEALRLICNVMREASPDRIEVLIDRPVHNSGRLKQLWEDASRLHRIRLLVRVEDSVDAYLAASSAVIATSDSGILDRCSSWFNLARCVVEKHILAARVVGAEARVARLPNPLLPDSGS